MNFFQHTWTEMNFKNILNNEIEALINLIHVQKALVGRHLDIIKRME